MTKLRKRMLEDMRIRNLAPETKKRYILQVAAFAKYFGKSPKLLGPEDIRSYQLYLLSQKKVASSTLNIVVCALRFLYRITLKKKWELECIPHARKESKLPVVLSQEEVAQFFQAIKSLKHRTILVASYSAGLRVLEITRLKIQDIDSKRMTIRVNQGKRRKDRYVMLSPKLLLLLREYWKKYRPTDWLFPGAKPECPIRPDTVRAICKRALYASGLKKQVTPHTLRHSFATHMLEGGEDIRKIQLLLGHRSVASTARYTRMAINNISKIQSPLDSLPDLNIQKK